MEHFDFNITVRLVLNNGIFLTLACLKKNERLSPRLNQIVWVMAELKLKMLRWGWGKGGIDIF